MRSGLQRWSPLALLVFGGACLAPTLAAPRRKPAAAPAAAPRGPVKAETADYVRDIKPLTQKYCVGCHNKKNADGSLDLTAFTDLSTVLKGRNQWEHISRRLADKEMPPKGTPQPTDAERAFLTTWVDTSLSSIECKVKEPGRVTMRRLNRAEYNNTVHDLLGIDFKPADDFPSDDVGYGFDNIGDVLSISPLLMEKYLNAAEKISGAAIEIDPPTHVESFSGANLGGQGETKAIGKTAVQLGANGQIFVGANFPEAGDYKIRVKAYAKQAGNEPAKMIVRLVGNAQRNQPDKDVETVEVKAIAPQVYEIPMEKMRAARRRVAFVFANDYHEPQNPDPAKRDRNLLIESVEVVGPIHPPKTPTEFQKTLLAHKPTNPAEWHTVAKTALAPFARRAWRRPVTDAEVDRLAKYVDLAQKQGDSYERGMQLALQAALVSPNFLFHVETNRQPINAKSPGYMLNDFELASRLSYFLWSSMPDETLLQLAERGELKKPEVLKAQALRMLKDPRSHALVENFADQWLNLRLLRNVNPDPARFPGWSEGLRKDMLQETELFFQGIMTNNRSIVDMLDAKYTYLNERLAKHYGISGVQGDQFREVALTDGRRGGLITQASILTITSNPTRTSPVKRGKWVLEQILGTPPPPPPPNVPELKTDGTVSGTLRQRMEQHRKDPACATCHQKMDTLGFGLENYDAVGAWRVKDGEAPVDASGELPGKKSFSGPAELKQILKGQKDQFAVAFTRQLTTFALGRGLEYYDRCTVDDICRKTAKSGYHLGDLVGEIVSSVPFRMRKAEEVVKK